MIGSNLGGALVASAITRQKLGRVGARCSIFVCFSVLWALPSIARAAVEFNVPIDTGWYWHDASGYLHQPSNTNFIVGHSPTQDYHNFFAFDFSSVSGPIVAASFYAGLTSFGAHVSNPPLDTWSLYDVSTSFPDLASGTNPGATYADLGTGQLYGTYQFHQGGGYYVSVDLNSLAINAMNNARNGHQFWAFGGAVDQIGSFYDILFDGSDATNSNVKLRLTTVPEPASASLAVIALGTLVVAVRRSS
jgi:PEP-CTERM motif